MIFLSQVTNGRASEEVKEFDAPWRKLIACVNPAQRLIRNPQGELTLAAIAKSAG